MALDSQKASQVTRVYEIRDDSVYGIDTDNDGAPDTCDLDCLAAGLQADDDDDGDGILDIDDPDADGDGVADNNPIDSDGDGLLDDVDADRDNDGVLNGDDAFPDVSMGLLVDTDRDGRPDECDAACEQRGMTADDDDDGDGIADSDDLYPLISLRRTEAVQLGLDIPYRGRLQMSADGLTIVISDPNEGSNDLNNNGAVRVFRYIDGAWDQMGDTIVGANEADYAGWGVALSEDGSSLGVGFPGEATFREMTMVSFVFIPGMVPPGSSGVMIFISRVRPMTTVMVAVLVEPWISMRRTIPWWRARQDSLFVMSGPPMTGFRLAVMSGITPVENFSS